MYTRQGRLAKALAWAHERGLSVDDELSYLREFEHATLARVLVAQYRSDPSGRSMLEAHGLLKRLLKAAEEGRLFGLLRKVRDLGVPLISVNRIEPGQADASGVKP